MLRTEASFSSLKDGYVFRASLELHLLKETYTNKIGSFKKCTKTTNFFSEGKKRALKRGGKRRKWRKSYSCTVRECLSVCSAAEEPRRILPLLRLYNGALWEGLLFRSALDGNASPPFLIRAKQLGLPFRVVNRRFIFCFPVSQMLKQHIWDSGSGLKTKASRAHSLLTMCLYSVLAACRKCFCWLYEIN